MMGTDAYGPQLSMLLTESNMSNWSLKIIIHSQMRCFDVLTFGAQQILSEPGAVGLDRRGGVAGQ